MVLKNPNNNRKLFVICLMGIPLVAYVCFVVFESSRNTDLQLSVLKKNNETLVTKMNQLELELTSKSNLWNSEKSQLQQEITSMKALLKETLQTQKNELEQQLKSKGNDKHSKEDSEISSHRFEGVLWKDGNAVAIPPEVQRLDTFVIHPKPEDPPLVLRYAFWDHTCEHWIANDAKKSSVFMSPEVLHHWGRWIEPESVAIDIGCHAGDTTIPIGVNADLTIGFEPNPVVFKILKANVDANPQLKIEIHQLAVANRIFNATWNYDCNGGASDTRSGSHPFDVTSVILKDYLTQHYTPKVISKISFIKIDTEGYDMFILDTLPELFKMMLKRPIIWIEWYASFQYKQNMELKSHIEAINYVAYDPDTGKNPVNLNTGTRLFRDLVLYPAERVKELIP